MDKLKKMLRRDKEEDEPGILEQADEATSLSCGRRMRCFAFTFIFGLLLSFMGVFMLWIPGLGIGVFATFYTAGNICALLSTMFLVGPCRQLKTMCAKERVLATIIMMVFLALTICAVVLWRNIGLALAFCALQFLAFIWYGLSYIPHARETFLKCCKACCC